MAFSYIVVSIVLLALVGVRVIVNWSRLRKAPGPTLAGFTDLWRAYQQYNGKLREKLIDLHAKHGPIVRYGVRSISISDPEIINVVYGSRAGFITADSYNVLLGHQNGKDIPSLVSTRDEKQHGALRRSVANAFTPTAVLDYEKWIDVTIGELLETVAKKPTFDLTSMILWYTMDAAARFSFGAPLGCLTAEDDVGDSIQLIRDRLSHWTRWASYPQIERLVYRNPILRPTARSPSSMVIVATAKLRARVDGRDTPKGGKEVDNAPDLLERFLEARKDFPQALDGPGIVGMLMSTISGAGDTTASTVAGMLFYILKNPEVMKTLEDELTAAGIHDIPAFGEVNKLPYLNAVLKETMRVFSTGSFPLERLVPAGGAVVSGMYFPEGTSVGCLPAAVHLNKKVFGEDADVFRPERWLIGDRERLRMMEAAHMGFSRGRRNCLGQNIAVLSMKKVVPALVMKFKLTLVDPDAPLGADYAPAAAVVEPIHVKSEIKS
ncbi:putative cytochrome p450 oxidoreductase protein [Rosellinia necatrix]|uniref:Putative cytochrome p450 oxidoreductase protein n=1 Tax=Rosellinia necatrix TaxID=77044 RepID=A0A1W2TP31_ROSNE|nr:putative cytochrome p450 oxidoreductase protein [Rosellinia necatrix]